MKNKVSLWFLSLVFIACVTAVITQLSFIRGNEKKVLVILASLPLIALLLWLFFRTGLATWAEKWIKSSYDDFLKEVEKSKANKKKQ